MASRSHPWRALWPAAVLLAAVLSPAAAAAAEPPAGEPPESAAPTADSPRTVVVGQAKLTWHLRPEMPDERPALVERFRQAAAAHLTGGELPVMAKAEPVTLPGGQLKVALPAALIPTMFIDAEGRRYCSDSTVAAGPAAVGHGAGQER